MFEIIFSDNALVLSFRWVLAVVFGVAAVHKLTSPASFVATIGTYRLLPEGLTVFFAYILIAAELLTTAALLLNVRWGSISAAVLLTFYTLAIAVNLLRGRRDIDCGCSGPYLRQTLSGWLVLRNLGFIALAFFTAATAVAARPLSILDWFTALAAATTFALLYFSANQIVSVNTRYRA